MLRVLDLFSGIGGFSLGLERAGMKTVRFIEQDAFCQAVLKEHWPEVPIDDDVTKAEFFEGEADVICGGFPCQDVSVAGKRAGVTGERSGLYRELVRAIRVVRPKHALLENVAELLRNGMGAVLGDLAEIGHDAEWDCVPAKALGAPHERDRVWIITHPNSERCGEAGCVQCRGQEERPCSGNSPRNVTYAQSKPLGSRGQPRKPCDVGQTPTDPPGHGCRQGRSRRPPDSFAWVRKQACGVGNDPAAAGLEGRKQSEASWETRTITPGGYSNPWRTWTDEPAIQGVDDGVPNWVDRTKATGNALLPQIPELIGRSLTGQHQ